MSRCISDLDNMAKLGPLWDKTCGAIWDMHKCRTWSICRTEKQFITARGISKWTFPWAIGRTGLLWNFERRWTASSWSWPMPIMLPTLSVNLHEVNVLRRICNITIPSEVDWCPSGNKWRIISFMCVKLIIFLSFGRKIMVFLKVQLFALSQSESPLGCWFRCQSCYVNSTWCIHTTGVVGAQEPKGLARKMSFFVAGRLLFFTIFLEIHTFSVYCYFSSEHQIAIQSSFNIFQ